MSQKLIQPSQVDVALDDLSDVDASPSDGEVLTFDNDTSSWIAAEPTGGSGSMDDFALGADSGDAETVGDGETVTIAGGTGIDTAVAATNTVTVVLDSASQASLALADSAT